MRINDLDLENWKQYDDEIVTDSLWIIDKRDNSGAHAGNYHGNFVPQIPRQLIQRYTQRGEIVLDPFLGSGTTLIEARRLERKVIGIEINNEVLETYLSTAMGEPCVCRVHEGASSGVYPPCCTQALLGNSANVDLGPYLAAFGAQSCQLVVMHPPYHDIIRFSDIPGDISTLESVEGFLQAFGDVVENTCRYLDKGRYLAVVIGDKYAKSEWVPLGFQCMNEVLNRGFSLKSICVKNYGETKGKQNQQGIWRYRALKGGFYVFKHEYILLFTKR